MTHNEKIVSVKMRRIDLYNLMSISYWWSLECRKVAERTQSGTEFRAMKEEEAKEWSELCYNTLKKQLDALDEKHKDDKEEVLGK